MTANLNKLPAAVVGVTPNQPVQPDAEAAPRVQSQSDQQADYRLVIEEDSAAPGGFIYKTVDWATGKVISQLPREELVKLRESPDYQAGTVFKTSA